VGFESAIPIFEREKTVHALDRAATVFGALYVYIYIYAGTNICPAIIRYVKYRDRNKNWAHKVQKRADGAYTSATKFSLHCINIACYHRVTLIEYSSVEKLHGILSRPF
jgi:hypothetical protein